MPLGWVELVRRDETVFKRRLDEGDPGAISFNRCAVLPAPSISIAREIGGESGLASGIVQIGAVTAHKVGIILSG